MSQIPGLNHIAIIPDGNRRWAKAHGLPTLEGHRRGAQRFRELANYARQKGIHTLTAWGFSTENWSRDAEEVAHLMDLFIWLIRENEKDAHRDGVRISHLGRKDRLPQKLLAEIDRIEQATSNHTQFQFNLCIDYGGQDEIIRSVNKVLEQRQKTLLENVHKYIINNPSQITLQEFQDKYAGNNLTAHDFYAYLDTAGQTYPNPDLLIRTSGEMRTSGLMPYQMSYAELYFEPAFLPDFTVEKLEIALQSYTSRDRRFGGNSK